MGIDLPDFSLPASDPDSEHEYWMSRAIQLARKAEQQGEVPIGAVMVQHNEIVGAGHNQPIATNDPSAHAEIVALRNAGQTLNNYRLIDTTLYVTLEPCIMCMGAILNARIKTLVFGATDPKRGAVCSALQLAQADFSNHHLQWVSGISGELCSKQLSGFFQSRRR